jgi:hypothetical protein
MAQDTTTAGFDAALKDVYAGPIRNQLFTMLGWVTE